MTWDAAGLTPAALIELTPLRETRLVGVYEANAFLYLDERATHLYKNSALSLDLQVFAAFLQAARGWHHKALGFPNASRECLAPEPQRAGGRSTRLFHRRRYMIDSPLYPVRANSFACMGTPLSVTLSRCMRGFRTDYPPPM